MIFFLARHYFFSKKFLTQPALWLGVLGLSLGVGTLVLAMSILTGFEKTLENSLIDSFGHLVISKKHWTSEQELKKSYHSIQNKVQASSAFISLDGVVTHKKNLSSVLLEGVDPENVGQVLNLKHRLVKGVYSMEKQKGDAKWAFVGKDLFKNLKLSLEEEFKVVLFVSSGSEGEFKKVKLRVRGVLDLGHFEANQRFIMTDLKTFQNVLNRPSYVSGLRLRLKNSDEAWDVKKNILFNQAFSYQVVHFKERYHNFFEAVRIQKLTLFLVLLLMVLIAGFNISSTLYMNVVKRFSEISILKAMGLSFRKIAFVFCLQGIFVGLLGSFLGVLLGVILGTAFTKLQSVWNFLPSKTYHLSTLKAHFLFEDIFLVVCCSVFICFLVSYGPSWKGAQNSIVKGLSYE